MFKLTKLERCAIAILLSVLVMSLIINIYIVCRPAAQVTLGKFCADIEPGGMLDPEGGGVLKVNINTAGMDEIMEFRGIGKSIAGRIVSYRNERGLFLHKEDIKKVKGVGNAIYERIKDEIDI